MPIHLQGRALEEIDAIFEVPFNPFRPTAVNFRDAERRVGELEGEKMAGSHENLDSNIDSGKPHVSHQS
jgi:MFS transporter, SP family, sugar:H+ symporter